MIQEILGEKIDKTCSCLEWGKYRRKDSLSDGFLA